MKIGVLACGGRMGRAVLCQVLADPDLTLVGGVERPGGDALGRDLGVLAGCHACGLHAIDDPRTVMAAADVVVEFSTPAATREHVRLSGELGRAHLVGTTGLTAEDHEILRHAARTAPVLLAANTSVGVTLLADLVRQAATALGPEFDIEIVEMHHRHKVDAPSGTALALGQAAASGRGVTLGEVAERGRDGITGARCHGAIGFASLRGGDVAGEHSVVFAGAGERIVLSHIATDRAIFARGAVRAARWLAVQPPGLYGMADTLAPARGAPAHGPA